MGEHRLCFITKQHFLNFKHFPITMSNLSLKHELLWKIVQIHVQYLFLVFQAIVILFLGLRNFYSRELHSQ